MNIPTIIDKANNERDITTLVNDPSWLPFRLPVFQRRAQPQRSCEAATKNEWSLDPTPAQWKDRTTASRIRPPTGVKACQGHDAEQKPNIDGGRISSPDPEKSSPDCEKRFSRWEQTYDHWGWIESNSLDTCTCMCVDVHLQLKSFFLPFVRLRILPAASPTKKEAFVSTDTAREVRWDKHASHIPTEQRRLRSRRTFT